MNIVSAICCGLVMANAAILSSMTSVDCDILEHRAILRERSRQWRANNRARAAEIAKASRQKAARERAVAEGRDPDVPWARPRMSLEERLAKRKVLDERANAIKKAKAAEQALAEGREPGRVGRPPRLTAEEKEASRVKSNRRRTLRTMERKKEVRRAKAIAEGRVPGQVGQPRSLSDEERIARRRQSALKAKWAKIEHVRAQNAAAKKAERAARAVAEGRVVGVLGHLSTFSPEAFAAYMESWPDRTDVFHGRLKTQNNRAKKLGIEGTITLADVRSACEAQRGHCAFCGKPFGKETPEIDHWLPLKIGGTNTADNIRLLHMRCNRTKAAKHPIELGLTCNIIDADLMIASTQGT